MSRVQVVSLSSGTELVSQNGQLLLQANLAVNLYQHGTNTPVTVYADSTSSTLLTLPLFTDSDGQLPGWVDSGQKVDFAPVGGTKVITADAIAADAPVVLPGTVLQDSRGTAAEDLLKFNGTSFVRLAIGSTSQHLLVRSDGTLKYTDAPTIRFSAYGPHANGTLDDGPTFATAITAANAVKGVLELDANKTYLVDLSVTTQGLSPTDGVTIKGQGRSTVILAGPNSNAAIQSQLFKLGNSDRVTFKDLQLQGPSAANLAVGQTIDAIKHNGTDPGATIIRSVYFSQFRYNVFHPGFTTGGTTVATCTLNAGIDMDDFEINGLGGSKASMGVLAQAASGTISIRNGYIHHCGLVSDIHQQGIYISRGYRATIFNVRFDFHFGGRGVQFEDQIDDLTTNGSPSDHQVVDTCWFGPNFDGSTTTNCGVNTGSAGTTTIRNCTFRAPHGRCILIRGKFLIENCRFGKDINDSGAWIIQASDTALGVGSGYPSAFNPIADGTIRGCRFEPTLALYDVQIPGGTTAAHHIIADGNKHVGGTTDAHYRIDAGASGATLLIGNRTIFNGTSIAGTNDVWLNDGKLVEVSGHCQFITTASGHNAIKCGTGTALGRLIVDAVNFSQSGTSITLTTTPTAYQLGATNYGTKPPSANWQTVTYGTSIASAGTPFATNVQAAVDGGNRTILRGGLKASAAVAANATIATLPSGLRPAVTWAGAAESDAGVGLLKITSAGLVTFSLALATGQIVYVDGVMFSNLA